MSATRRRAVIAGGGIAGLAAAASAVSHFDEVVLLERDHYNINNLSRMGVPQGFQSHVLLTKGLNLLCTLIPDFQHRLLTSGAEKYEWLFETRSFSHGNWKPIVKTGIYSYTASRNLIENTLLTYLKTKNNLRILEGACIKELILAENQTQIAKVYFHYQDQTSELDVDLFVDASGRDSTSPLWLESFCGEKVPFTNKGSHVGYATQVYRLDIPSKHPDWKLLSLYDMDSPGVRCGGALFIENKQVMVLATGANQDYPSNEEKSFKDFLFSIPGSEQLYPIFDAGTPVSSVKGFRRTENRLFHFDKVSSLPKNFFIIGDAVCVFNPSYGQGMTTALAAASLLNRFLITNTPLDSRKFQKALAKILSFPWISATVSDLLYSRAAKEKMSVSDYLKSEALYYLIKSTNYDSRLTKSFVEVLHMVKPVQILFSPHYIPAFARALSSPK